MDGGTLAVIGTLSAVIVTGFMSYFLQGRQRNWALKDEERNYKREIESEQRRLKRELLVRRLANVEEIMGLKIRILSNAIDKEIGLGAMSDADLGLAVHRVDEINSDAYAAVIITGSEELKSKYGVISGKYWNYIQNGELEPDDWKATRDAQIAVMKLIDDMRTLGN